MSTEHLASIYYGFVIEDNDILFKADKEAVERFVDDDWYIGEHYGQGFYYHCWTDDALVLGVECYETDDIVNITPYTLSKIIEETTEGLKEIYKELFPGRDVKEPSVLLIQRDF